MSDPTTTTTAAGQVRGQEVPGGMLFAGIPFAQPPVGALRLRPPRPLAAWTGVRAADAFRPAPAQGGTALGGGAQMPWASDEDCLYLNLFTPALDGSRPAIVWIYGGGFEVGTASPPMTDVAALARATGTVVVAMNYRLGALGWLHLADLGGPDWAGSTNLGLQDQIAALHWVRENIAAFGGDPGNITVAGESAGAFSIGALLADIRRAGIDQSAEMLAAYRARYPHAGLTELRSRFLSDAIYLIPASRLAEAQVAAGGKAYRAVFAADPFGPEAGTPHGMDIMYIFDLLDANNLGTPASHAVRDDLHRAWREFAATGDPGWPGYDPGATGNTRLFGTPGGLTTEPPRDEVTAHWR